jgi:hypothetical protein
MYLGQLFKDTKMNPEAIEKSADFAFQYRGIYKQIIIIFSIFMSLYSCFSMRFMYMYIENQFCNTSRYNFFKVNVIK